MIRHLLAAALLVAPLLTPFQAHAWGGGPGSGYYGAGPFTSDVDGSFSFGASMRGSGRGYGANRYGAHRGYPPYPPAMYRAPQSPSWILRGVNFKYDSAELMPASMAILDSVADVLRSRPAEPLEVGGHASAEGDVPYNMELSRRRAQTVRAYLVQRGVDPDLLTYRGYGESRPLATNVTEPGRILNRRVELTPMAYASRR